MGLRMEVVHGEYRKENVHDDYRKEMGGGIITP